MCCMLFGGALQANVVIAVRDLGAGPPLLISFPNSIRSTRSSPPASFVSTAPWALSIPSVFRTYLDRLFSAIVETRWLTHQDSFSWVHNLCLYCIFWNSDDSVERRLSKLSSCVCLHGSFAWEIASKVLNLSSSLSILWTLFKWLSSLWTYASQSSTGQGNLFLSPPFDVLLLIGSLWMCNKDNLNKKVMDEIKRKLKQYITDRQNTMVGGKNTP